MILYFSGTGNSRYTAELISMVVGDDLVSMNELIKSKSKSVLKSDKPFVFVAPVYGGRIPKVAETYINETRFEGNKNAYFVVTCAASAWKTVNYSEKLCNKKGFTFLGFNSVVMPQNHLTMNDTKSDVENDKLISDADPKIKKIAEVIKSNKPLRPEKSGNAFMSGVLNPLMYSTMMSAKGFYTSDACKGCGQCVKRCALNNIKMENGKPQWGRDCTHCMACIGGCSYKAIEYGKKTAGRNRFYNTRTPHI